MGDEAKYQATTLTIDKLHVIDRGMKALYSLTWERRWPWEAFQKYWGPLVEPYDAHTITTVVTTMVRTRTDKSPPMPAEFVELLRTRAPIPTGLPRGVYAERSAESEAKMVEELAWAKRVLGKP